MSVKNDRNVLFIGEGTVNDNHSLNHLAVHGTSKHLLGARGDGLNEVPSWRKHAFNVILPRKISNLTENDLRLIRVSLKNAISVSSVHLLRVERELKKRGSSFSILR
jgi:hypothetical protein